MFIEKTERKIYRLDLNDDGELEEYNRLLKDPSIKIIDKQVLTTKENMVDMDARTSTSEDHIIALLEVEECGF